MALPTTILSARDLTVLGRRPELADLSIVFMDREAMTWFQQAGGCNRAMIIQMAEMHLSKHIRDYHPKRPCVMDFCATVITVDSVTGEHVGTYDLVMAEFIYDPELPNLMHVSKRGMRRGSYDTVQYEHDLSDLVTCKVPV